MKTLLKLIIDKEIERIKGLTTPVNPIYELRVQDKVYCTYPEYCFYQEPKEYATICGKYKK